MDSVYCVCDCLLFRLKQKNYLYRITPELIHEMPENQLFIKNYKFTPDFIILPSQPYHLGMQSFGWFIPFQIKNSISILIKDSNVRKIIEMNFGQIGKQTGKWQLWNEGQIPENQLLERLQKLYRQDTFGKKINFSHPLFKKSYDRFDPKIFTFYVPEISEASALCHNSKILGIDPDVNFLQIMKQNGIRQQKLKSILVTGIHQKDKYMRCRVFKVFLGWFRYLIKGFKPSLIMNENNYKLFQKWLNALFFLDDKVWNSYPVKILESNFKYKLPFIGTIEYNDDIEMNQAYTLQISSLVDIKNKKIGQSTKIRIYSTILKCIPQALGNLTFIITSQINKYMREKLHESPKLLRQKIIYNRQKHKYNHKYFCRLNNENNFFQFPTESKIQPNIYNTKQLFHQYITKVHPQQIQQNKLVNCTGRAVFINAGKVINEKEQIIEPGSIDIKGQNNFLKILTSVYDIDSINCYELQMLNRIKVIQENLYAQKKQNNLQQIQNQNIFLKGLTNQQLLELEFIVKAEKLQAGEKINISQYKTGYFVIKGGLKIVGSELVAGKNHFIGTIRPAIQGTPWEGTIDVVRDSWVLQVPLQQFGAFLGKYPDKLIQFLSYGLIFS